MIVTTSRRSTGERITALYASLDVVSHWLTHDKPHVGDVGVDLKVAVSVSDVQNI